MGAHCGACARPIERGGKCMGCGKPRCARHRYSYVDGNNGAITKHSKEYCLECYKNNHPEQWY